MRANAPSAAVDQTDEYREAIETAAQRQVNRFRKAARGVTPRSCPICGYHGMFTAFGYPPRIDARCPKCNSLERHRLLYLFAERFNLFRPSHDALHFAPEAQLAGYLRDMTGRYETADLSPKRHVTHHVDIEGTGLAGKAMTGSSAATSLNTWRTARRWPRCSACCGPAAGRS